MARVAKEERVLPASRQIELANALAKADVLAIDDLARRFGVSMQTIRRDLAVLEQRGLGRRTYGGVVVRDAIEVAEPLFLAREQEHGPEKHAIAQYALSQLQPGESIFLDAATSVLALARLLPDDWVGDVVVSSLPAANEVARRPGVRLTLIGGEFRESSRCFVGPIAERTCQDLYVDVALISARGIHPRHGLTESTSEHARLKRTILGNADRTIVLADSSKFMRTAPYQVAPLDAVQLVITDEAARGTPAFELLEARQRVVVAPLAST